jgi:hypothetical protein
MSETAMLQQSTTFQQKFSGGLAHAFSPQANDAIRDALKPSDEVRTALKQ